eukprot:77103-Prymnesium_polylepis.1
MYAMGSFINSGQSLTSEHTVVGARWRRAAVRMRSDTVGDVSRPLAELASSVKTTQITSARATITTAAAAIAPLYRIDPRRV